MYTLKRSNKENKKYVVINERGKKIHFGAKGYGDFIYYNKQDKEKALKKRRAYIARHRVNEDFNNKEKAGFWAKNILWNKPTLKGSIKDTERKYNIRIKY